MEINIDQYPIYFEQQVQWGEMDAFQHVNNSVYFKYFENARIKFMENIDILNIMEGDRIGPILAKVEANFRIPLTYPGTIRTYFRVKSIGNTSFVVEHLVWSMDHKAVACVGDGICVMMDYSTNQKVLIPDHLRTLLTKYMIEE